jgi:leucyl aminopeptidase (aminopeptidase T)
MLATSLVVLLIPLWILLGLLALFGLLGLLGRVRGGRYLRPLFALMAKVPLLRRLLQKASQAAIERTNPELASAMRKMERSGALRDPQRAQAALSQLTAQERRALLEMQEQQGGVAPEATNRQMRRRLERVQKGARRK